MAVRDGRGDVKQTTRGFRDPRHHICQKQIPIPCLQGISDKSDALKEYCKKNNINLDEVAYVGNDINDLEAMELAGITFCPADAHNSIKNISDHVLKSEGGQGVVREILDHLINN